MCELFCSNRDLEDDDDIEKDGNFPSKSSKRPARLRRINKPMLLPVPHLPDKTAGACVLIDDKDTKVLVSQYCIYMHI